MPILPLRETSAFAYIPTDYGVGIGEVYGWAVIGKQRRRLVDCRGRIRRCSRLRRTQESLQMRQRLASRYDLQRGEYFLTVWMGNMALEYVLSARSVRGLFNVLVGEAAD